jgi:acylphosphatase
VYVDTLVDERQPMMARAHVFISGSVQGVFFRAEIRSKARNRDVTGWVRNLPDGRVEAVFEGEHENVENMINFCRRGPSGATVTKVDVHWEDYTGNFKTFNIYRTT